MSGLLNKALTDGSVQQVAQVSGGVQFASLNINACNDSNVDITLRVWITLGTTPGQVDLIEPSVVVPAKGRWEETVRIVSPNERIFVQANTGLVVRVESVDEV